jgi:serine phosphatase RsbU (regulator of sigma subunit)
MRDASYTQEVVPWSAERTLVLYTDGLSEARRNREFLDLAGVRALLRAHAPAPTPLAVLEGIYRDLRRYAGDHLHDDVALLAIRSRRE